MQNWNSKIIEKKPIDWTYTVKISELRMDPNLLQAHTDRVNAVFSYLSEEERRQQIQNIIVRDNIFNLAMEHIEKFYEVEFEEEELNGLINRLGDSLPTEYLPFIPDIAKKSIKKDLIFSDLAEEFDIQITDAELINILNSYYSQTKQPIKDFMKDDAKFNAARKTLLEEKITAFIVDKMPRDLSELEAKLYASLKEQEEQAKKGSHNSEEGAFDDEIAIEPEFSRKGE